VTFVIVGDGDLKDTLSEYIANNNISHLVQLLEFQNNVSLFYSAIDGLIMPARYEGIPHNILLDAIQLRIPLIMSNISDANQYLPINNLFDPFNPKNFMETLQQFIYKPDDFIVYTDLGKHSYKSYRNNINKLFGKETIAAS
jgi:glycosyltransferase involved in cell wall biosynthesis